MKRTIYLASPRGFCAGVVRAIDVVNLALEAYGRPIYVLNEIVHNRYVVDELRQKGVHFVQSLDEIPDNSRAIFSAHGISPEVREYARKRNLKTIDATCPLVTKVHLEAVRYRKAGYTIILIGHKEHDEVIGTLGEAPENMVVIGSVEEADSLDVPDPQRIAFLTQTTLSLDDTREIVNRLKQRFPQIKGPAVADICYATQNRQMAVQQMAAEVDLILVIGSANSSNSNRLVEVAEKSGVVAHLIEHAASIDPAWLTTATRIGITAGASSPEPLIANVVNHLQGLGFTDIRQFVTIPEDVHFALPPELEKAIAQK